MLDAPQVKPASQPAAASPAAAPGPTGNNGSAPAPAPEPTAVPPIRNMRVTFWGVQGSCPIFPTVSEIQQFAQQVALYTLERAMRDGSVCPLPTDGLDVRAEVSEKAMAHQAAEDFLQEVGLPDFPVYGGDTSCIEVETAEREVIVFDMGTGVRDFSNHLLQRWAGRRDRVLHVFGTHEHLDHRQGLTFASFCYARPEAFTVRIYGPYMFLKALDERYGLFSRQVNDNTHLDDPVDYKQMSARFIGTELRPGGKGAGGPEVPWAVLDSAAPVRIGNTSVNAFPTYHGGTNCFAYKVRHGNASFVYCTDHELRHGDDPANPRQVASQAADAEVCRQCQGVDAAYFDGQYFLNEYLGKQGIGTSPAVRRVDWGHGCIEDVVARARRCRIGHTYIGHHDPERQWQERVRIDTDLIIASKAAGPRIELAKAREVIDL